MASQTEVVLEASKTARDIVLAAAKVARIARTLRGVSVPGLQVAEYAIGVRAKVEKLWAYVTPAAPALKCAYMFCT